MDLSEIYRRRLVAQGLTDAQFQTPYDAVKWFGAVQAQDYPAAKWALGLRLPHLNEVELDDAFNAGEIVRTHVMRPTWHFIAPEDLKWMQMLTGPRVKRLLSHYERKMGIDEAMVKKSQRAMASALGGENFLTRNELIPFLKKAGVAATGMKLGFLVSHAELDALICSGPRKGKQFTYALVDERVKKSRKLSHEEALTELTRRYFTSHGPATLNDFGWWSGLTQAEIKQGMGRVKNKLAHEEAGGKTYYFSNEKIPVSKVVAGVHLLPNYDEYTIAYKDTRAVFNPPMKLPPNRANVVFNHSIVLDGHIVGMWKKIPGKKDVKIQTTIFRDLTTKEMSELNDAAQRYGKFVGLSVKVTNV